MARTRPEDVKIGAFDVLAAYTYARALLEGVAVREAKERAMIAAILGANARIGRAGDDPDDHAARKADAERKKKVKITAESFDKQVANPMGTFFQTGFLPTLKALVETGLFFDEVKKLLQIPATWGATIRGDEFADRSLRALAEAQAGLNPRLQRRQLLDDDDEDDDDDFDD